MLEPLTMNFRCLLTLFGYFLCMKYLVTPTSIDFCILLETTWKHALKLENLGAASQHSCCKVN